MIWLEYRDYALNGEGDLYFNLLYNDLDQAFRRSHEEIHLGQDSDDFKTRLGSLPRALSFYLRAPNPVLQAALQLFSRMLLPKIPAIRTHDVFKATAGSDASVYVDASHREPKAMELRGP